MENVYHYIASHGTPRHYYPQHFKPLFHASKRFSPIPRIIPKSGGTISQSLVGEIDTKAVQVAPQKQFIVVTYADNNFRRGQKVEDVLPLFSQIISIAEKLPFCRVVVTSMVPSFGRDEEMKEEFQKLEEALKKMCHNSSKASYCSFVNKLMVRGKLNAANFDDDVHLSSAGAKIMAESIHRHLVNLPKIKE